MSNSRVSNLIPFQDIDFQNNQSQGVVPSLSALPLNTSLHWRINQKHYLTNNSMVIIFGGIGCSLTVQRSTNPKWFTQRVVYLYLLTPGEVYSLDHDNILNRPYFTVLFGRVFIKNTAYSSVSPSVLFILCWANKHELRQAATAKRYSKRIKKRGGFPLKDVLQGRPFSGLSIVIAINMRVRGGVSVCDEIKTVKVEPGS